MEMPIELPLNGEIGEALTHYECDEITDARAPVEEANSRILYESRIADREISMIAEIAEREEIMFDYPRRFRRDVYSEALVLWQQIKERALTRRWLQPMSDLAKA